ncbi:hypothetical protein RUND412_000533 [Rhizina undulata]
MESLIHEKSTYIMEYHKDEIQDLEPVNDWRSLTPYNAGIKRKKVTFVPAGYLQTEAFPGSTRISTTGRTGRDVSEFYLKLVGLGSLKGKKEAVEGGKEREASGGSLETDTGSQEIEEVETREKEICSTCNLPILDSAHETSTAHQSSLPHSRPPHHYPRSSKGLKVLVESGWNPDDTLGLGPEGQGLRFPLKAVPKGDTHGIGMKFKKGVKGKEEPEKKKILGVKEVRKVEKERAGKRRRLLLDMGREEEFEKLLYGKMDE